MSSKIKQLEQKEAKIRKQLNAEKDKEIKEKFVPFLLGFVGKCFMYPMNSYSCPEKESDYWNTYKKIVDKKIDKDGYVHFIIEEFQIDTEGYCKYEIKSNYISHDGRKPFIDSGWKEISEKEYQKEKGDFWKECAITKKLLKLIN